MRNTYVSNIIKLLVFLSIGLFLLWLASRTLDEQGWAEMKNSLRGVNYGFVLLSILAGIISHLIRAIRWNQMIQTFGYRPKLYNAFFAVMIGYLANYVFLRMGEVMRCGFLALMRCGFLARYDEPPADKLLGTVISERVVDLSILIVLFSITILSQYQLLSNFFYDKIWLGLSEKFSNLFGTGLSSKLLLLFVVGMVIFAIYLLFKKMKIADKLTNFLSGIKEGILSIKNIKNVPLFVFYSLAIWLMYFLMILLVFYSLDATKHLGFTEGLTILVFGTFGIIAVQGGIGAYHLIVQQVLLLYGVSAAAGLAFGWVSWGVQTVLIVVVGVISFILLPIINKKSEGGFFSSLQA